MPNPHPHRLAAPLAGRFLLILTTILTSSSLAQEWTDWQKYRASVSHPNLAIKPGDIARAKENAQRYPWAKSYIDSVINSANEAVGRVNETWAEKFIELTTPGDAIFTPCPSCRDQGKPYVPHGTWTWTPSKPDTLSCEICKAQFPNDNYPETIVLESKWAPPQKFTFYAGEPFKVFGYENCRPSFTGSIRTRKVRYASDICRNLGEAYAITGDTRFAHACRLILLRFASVYPKYIVHVGYGEYADMDPRIASKDLKALPEDELCYPPNKPDRQLNTAYWSAGRAGGVGGEGRQVKQWVEAYDFTCEAKDASGESIYSDADRRTIEKDLLLESCYLALGDPLINNKSVGNRSAAALVGMCLGEPSLVRFGLEGFYRTIDGWFLKDGTTPESPAYGLMALNGIDETGQAMRGHSDPPGYVDGTGKRLESLDLYRQTNYAKVWEMVFATLQGDLRYPPFADSYVATSISEHFVDLMAANYPENSQYLALLKELCGPDLSMQTSATAVYYREPGLASKPAPKFILGDICPPDLRIGFLRTGDDGRESLLTLSASHWGSHHHKDSLNLYYWKNGRELLTDLGYLWDHPEKHMTTRTLAHNTVLIDEQDQQTTDRGGEVEYFNSIDRFKVMRASSRAYVQAKLYQRTSAVIEHGAGRSYVVDVFRVDGGKTQDFVYHGPNGSCELDGVEPSSTAAIYDLSDVRSAAATATWRAQWKLNDTMDFIAWNLPQPGEQVLIGQGWGQRSHHNTDRGATIPYIVRRGTGEGVKTFVTVFEGAARGKQLVKEVRRVEANNAIKLEIVTDRGVDSITVPHSGDPTAVIQP